MIHKQKIDFYSNMQLPMHSSILKVAYQGEDELYVWYAFEEKYNLVPVKFHEVSTGFGGGVELTALYLDTVFDSGGFVWHIFVSEVK
jgi:hypothetical protein